jgi:glutathione S-transferase
MLNRVLTDSDYLLDGRFTVADLNMACVLSHSRLSAIDVSRFPKVAAWAERCHGRPALKDVHAMRAAAG